MTDRIKSARVTDAIEWVIGERSKYMKGHAPEEFETILEALSAYERLQGVDLEGLNKIINKNDDFVWTTLTPDDLDELFKAAQLVADIRGK